MNINDLNYFIRIVEEKSLSKAAGKLFISYQGLSKAMKSLESELNCPLFEDGSRRGRLTEYGEELYSSARKIVAEWERMCTAMQHIRRRNRRLYNLGIAMGVDMPFPHFRERMDRFVVEHGNIVTTDAWDSYCEEKVESEELDLAITFGPVSGGAFVSLPLVRGYMAALVHQQSELFGLERLTIRDIKGLDIITVNRHFRNHDILVQACRLHGYEPRVVLNTMNLTKTLFEYQDKKAIGVSNTLSYPMKQIGDYRVIPIVDQGTECQINILMSRKLSQHDGIMSIRSELADCLLK